MRASILLTGAALGLVCALGCTDRPVCIPPPTGGEPAKHLSDLGLFAVSGAHAAPVGRVVPYTVKVPFYSDGEEKQRFVLVPAGQKVDVSADRFELPEGTLLIKTFSLPIDERDPSLGERRIETRILRKTGTGFLAGTYVWSDDQADAVCSGGNEFPSISWIDRSGFTREETFHVPGTSQCPTCHGDGGDGKASRALGWRQRQLDVVSSYPDGTPGQLAHLAAAGVLAALPPPATLTLTEPYGPGPLADRARSFLDTNCAICHVAGGYASSTGVFFTLENTDGDSLGFCRSTSAVDGRTTVIDPGHPDSSELLARMASGDPLVCMPRGPNLRPDQAGIALMSAWIGSLPAGRCAP